MNELKLHQHIELMRTELAAMVNLHGNFCNDQVIAASQRLDQLLVIAQRRNAAKAYGDRAAANF